MSSEGKIINKTVAHNIYVQRFAGGKWNDIKFYIADLEKEVTALVTSADFAAMTPRLQRQLISKVNSAVSAALKLLDDDLMLGMEEFSEYEIGFTQKMVTDSVKATAVLSAPTLSRNQIRAALESYVLNVEPGNQMTMRVALEKFKVAQVERLQQTLRDGFISGKTTEQMANQAKEILKTNVINNLKTTAQQAETIVRTATNSTAQMSRDLFYDENPDVITGYKIVATLDSDTTPICQYYDGKKFTLKTDPRPAFHWGCRTTTTPTIADKYNLSTGKETRSSATGQVSTKLTYGGWLRQQSVEVQNEVMGVTRAKAFRKGGYSIDRFVDDTGKYYTIEELKVRDLIE